MDVVTGSPSYSGFFRSRKKVLSSCLVVLAVSFAVIMLGGLNQTRTYKVNDWVDPGARHQTAVAEDSGNDGEAARRPDDPHRSDGGLNVVRSSDRTEHGDDYTKPIPESALEGALEGEARSREDALNAETEPVDQHPGTREDAVVQDVASEPGNGHDDSEGALYPEEKQTQSRDGAVKADADKPGIQRGNTSLAESEQSTPLGTLVQGLQKMSTEGVPFRQRVSLIPQRQSATSSQTTTPAVYYDTCERCCYCYTTIDRDIVRSLNETELRTRGCRQRLPDAMIFGVKKGGTTTLKNFLSYHPGIAFTQKELKFFTSPEERAKGMEYYRSRMIYSTPDQVSMEKTPAYSHYPKVPGLIKRVLPNIKLIIIMRDPVQRAISDYVHMQVTIAKRCSLTFTATSTLKDITIPDDCDFSTSYEIRNTFEESVIDSRGRVKTDSHLITKGLYVQEIQRYLQYFSPEQILAIDGETFIEDPYPAVKAVERFLGVADYFARDHFYFDDQKGFFCLNKPIPQNCMSPAKGRPHPEVREETLRKLRDFYRPYNDRLRQLVNIDFRWSS